MSLLAWYSMTLNPGNPDCDDPKRLCQDLLDDYHSANKLLVEYPDRYKYVHKYNRHKQP